MISQAFEAEQGPTNLNLSLTQDHFSPVERILHSELTGCLSSVRSLVTASDLQC